MKLRKKTHKWLINNKNQGHKNKSQLNLEIM